MFFLGFFFVFQSGAAFPAICCSLELKSVFCKHFGARISHLRAHLAFGFKCPLGFLAFWLLAFGFARAFFWLLAFGFWLSVAPYLLDKSRKDIIWLLAFWLPSPGFWRLVLASLGSWLYCFELLHVTGKKGNKTPISLNIRKEKIHNDS